MTADAWIAAAVLVATIVVLVLDRYPPVVVLGGGLAAMMFADVVEPDVALGGFSSTAVATIAALYVLAGAATATGLFSGIVERALSGAGSSITRLCVGTAALSSFVPNTPVVAMFAPQVVRWSERHGSNVSRYLMPMSFASILGGVVTLIGTSTNLVVSDLVQASGGDALSMFEITAVGLPIAVVGVAVLVTVGPRLLPDRTPSSGPIGARARQFQIALVVDVNGPLVGRSVGDAGLRNLTGVYLSFIERAGDEGRVRVVAVTPNTVLEADDVCCFVGEVARIVDLHDVDGLRSTEDEHVVVASGTDTAVFEAVVAPLSSLVGQSLRSIGFRVRFGGAVMAIHREGEDLGGQLGRIDLRAGDVLLVLADAGFEDRWRSHGDFSLVAGLDQPPPVRRSRAAAVAVIIVAFITSATVGIFGLFESAVLAAIAVVAVGAIGANEARRAVDVNVVLTMAVAIGLGRAISASGLAGEAAELIEGADAAGVYVVVLATLLSTILLSELLTNTAAAALMVPVALGIAEQAQLEPRLLAITVLFGASCSFLSPVGYQTNLMVAGLGGYRFADFTRVGFPLTATVITVVTALAPTIYG